MGKGFSIHQLKNYESAFGLVKHAFIVSILMNVVIAGWCMYWVVDTRHKACQQIWVLSPNYQVYPACLQADLPGPDRIYEYENHVKLFYRLFFAYDEHNYQRNIAHALHLIGESGKKLYGVYKREKVYEQLLEHNLIVDVVVDEVKIDMGKLPAKGVVKARQLVRSTENAHQEPTISNLHATFVLHDVARSHENPHGVKIDEFEIFNDAVIQ